MIVEKSQLYSWLLFSLCIGPQNISSDGDNSVTITSYYKSAGRLVAAVVFVHLSGNSGFYHCECVFISLLSSDL